MDHHGCRCRAVVEAMFLVGLEVPKALREAEKAVQHSLEVRMVE